METIEDPDTYVTQLREVFISCDTSGSGCLNESELNVLCCKLHLTDHTNFLVQNLLDKRSATEVEFEDFKNCFIDLLSQSVRNEDEDVENNYSGEDVESDETFMNIESAAREVSPKFTLGRKKYGRRSRPASVVEEEEELSPVSTQQNSSDNSSPLVSLPSKALQKADSGPGKRPVSPGDPQQPPVKSGRMNNSYSDIGSHDQQNYMHQRSSDSFAISFENNPVAYLRQTWKKLGIGKQGYLNVDELALVCEHIGMDMTEEVVSQLFVKLDCDQDGRISFDEFLQGLFQHGEPQGCEPVPRKEIPAASAPSLFKESSRDDQISTSSISGIFSSIDTASTGYASGSSILELWESLEMPSSPQILKELGFNPSQKINLSDLTSFLEEEIIVSITSRLGQLAYASLQNELNYLRQVNEQISVERNKLRENLEEANTRSVLLAQEVDENHTRLENAFKDKLILAEKKYHEQVRELAEDLQLERDSVAAQRNKLIQQLQDQLQRARDEESQLKSHFHELEQDNSRLELELQDVTEKYLESEKQKEMLQKEFMLIPDLKARLELESRQGEISEKQHESLLLENENYKRLNQQLQDKIDELSLEIENLHQQSTVMDSSAIHNISRTHSWLSDYKKTSLLGFKRRGSDTSSDENSEDESPTIGKMRRTFRTQPFMTPEDASPNSFEPDVMEDKSISEDSGESKEIEPIQVTRPTNADVLLKELFVEREQLMIKLCKTEELQQKAELSNMRLRNKCRILSRLAYDITKTVKI